VAEGVGPSHTPRVLPFDVADADAWGCLTASPIGNIPLASDRITLRPPAAGPQAPLAGGAVRLSRAFAGDVPVGWEVRLPLGAESVFGGGESYRSVDLRGTRRVLLNSEPDGEFGAGQAYLHVPFFWSTAGWGLLLGTGAPVLADVGAEEAGVARFVALGREVELTLLRGDPPALLRAYGDVTGRVGPWPDWAFGTWMSRASYLSAVDIHRVLDELQAADCPVDVVHVDAWLAGNVFREFTCSWRPDRTRFPEGWTDAVRARGVRVSLWLNPFVLAGSPLDRELRRKRLLLIGPDGAPAATCDRANRHIVDFTNPAAAEWWGDQVLRLLAEERPDALKLDFGEEIPLGAICRDGRTGLEVRNAYALLYQRATAAAIPAGHPTVPFFCRSGSTGSQTTPCHWVGDTPATWDGMAQALRACLSLALSGFALVGHDAGGFHTPGSMDLPARILDGEDAHFAADVEPELFGRWAQWAAFSPVTRFHGTGRREPTAYAEPWRSAAIAALRRRRDILPLLRAALTEAQQTGLPLLRPTALTHPHDPIARRAWHQHQLGADLIVAPILAPGGRTTVWLPDGEWEPVLGAPHLRGPGLHDVAVTPEAFPVYARSGALSGR
jgi:alpha-D-xyloside xylohydrolase